jgi:hypothetical protein
MTDLGKLLIKLAMRKETESDAKFEELLKSCDKPEALFKVIHGTDAAAGSNFAGTIYELIMKLLGKKFNR